MFNNETIILIFNFTILFADSQNAPELEISNNPAEDDDYDLQTGRFSEGKFTYVHLCSFTWQLHILYAIVRQGKFKLEI